MQTLEIKSRTLKKRFSVKEYDRTPLILLTGKTLTVGGSERLLISGATSESQKCATEYLVTLNIQEFPGAATRIVDFDEQGNTRITPLYDCAGPIESMIADGWEQEVEYGRGDVHMKINASCDGFAQSLNGLADLFDQRTPLIGAGGTVTISQPDDEPKQRYTIQPKPKSLLAFQYVWVSIAVAGFALMVSKILNPRGTILEYSAVYSILLSVFWSVRACLEIARRLRNRHGRDPVLGINFRATNA